jgi:hypothetical protein
MLGLRWRRGRIEVAKKGALGLWGGMGGSLGCDGIWWGIGPPVRMWRWKGAVGRSGAGGGGERACECGREGDGAWVTRWRLGSR